MDRLGEDLVLLAIGDDGRLPRLPRLRRALLSAELARLGEAGRIRIVRHRVVVSSELPLGDQEVDATLARLVAAQQPPPHISKVLRHPPRGIRSAYLIRLAGQGALRRRTRLIGRDRWYVVDAARHADVRALVERIATSQGPASMEDATLAGLIYAADMDAVIYPGLPGWQRRQRLERLARRSWPVSTVSHAPAATSKPGPAPMLTDSTMQGTSSQADHDATRAAIDAVVRESVRAVMNAITNVVTSVEHHGHSGHGGISHHSGHSGISHGGGGGHHGH